MCTTSASSLPASNVNTSSLAPYCCSVPGDLVIWRPEVALLQKARVQRLASPLNASQGCHNPRAGILVLCTCPMYIKGSTRCF